jgi:hypothetical protein
LNWYQWEAILLQGRKMTINDKNKKDFNEPMQGRESALDHQAVLAEVQPESKILGHSQGTPFATKSHSKSKSLLIDDPVFWSQYEI